MLKRAEVTVTPAPVQHVLEDLERQAGDADMAHQALRLERQQRRQRLIHNLGGAGGEAV